jgi:hypothetical protein
MKYLLFVILAAFAFSACKSNHIASSLLADSTRVQVTLEVISGGDSPVLTKGMPGMDDNKYGLEGGTVIQRPDGYHLFTA